MYFSSPISNRTIDMAPRLIKSLIKVNNVSEIMISNFISSYVEVDVDVIFEGRVIEIGGMEIRAGNVPFYFNGRKLQDDYIVRVSLDGS